MRGERPRIVVVGSLVYDLVARTERRPAKGETIFGTGFGMFPGGKGANQAVQAARLGAEVWMVGRVGDDFFGAALRESLNASGVDTCYVRTDPETTTAVASIVVDQAGDNSIIVVPQANMRCTVDDVAAAEEVIAGADILLLQLEIPLAVNIAAAATARRHGVKVILNPAPAQALPAEHLRQADLLTPNETELGLLTGTTPAGMVEVEEAAKILLAQGPPAVIVTLGEQGALLVEPGRTEHFPACPVQAVDSTAAGDAFTGGLAVALAEGRSLPEAIGLANAVGALTVTRAGAQPSLPDRAAVEAFRSGQS